MVVRPRSPESRRTAGDFCPHFARILFAAGCFRTLLDVAAPSKIRVIPRNLSFRVAMQNAQNVFEPLQGVAAVTTDARVTLAR
jgi:hypothetical protein